MPRWILLVLLAPLLGFALLDATRYDPSRIHGMAFSSSGRELRVFRGREEKGLFEPVVSSCEVRAWDVASGRLLRSTVTGHGQLSADEYGRVLFDQTRSGHVRMLDSDTLQPLGEWQLPGWVGHVIGCERMLVVSWNDGKRSAETCLWRKEGTPPQTLESGVGELSANGQRLFISRGTPSVTSVYAVDDEGITRQEKLSFDGSIGLASPAGDVVFVLRNYSWVVHNLRTGADYVWQPAAFASQYWDMFFSTDGRLFYAIHEGGELTTYDTSSGRLVAAQQLAWLSEPLQVSNRGDYAVSPDRRLIAGTTDYRHVRIWDTSTGELVTQCPDHRWRGYGLGAAYLTWCLAWVGIGVKQQSHAGADAVLVNSLLLAVLLAYAATRPRRDFDPTVAATGLGFLAAVTGMLCVWWIHGSVRWSLRLAGMVAGLGAIAALPLATGHRSDPRVWNMMLGTVCYVPILTLLLTSWRWRRVTIASDVTAPPSGKANWQLPLRDALIIVATVAFLLGVLRLAVPGQRSPMLLLYPSSHGVGLAVTTCVAAWVVLSQRKLALRVAVLAMATSTSCAIPAMLFSSQGVALLWWCATFHAASATAIVLSLGIFRLHGFRLVTLGTR